MKLTWRAETPGKQHATFQPILAFSSRTKLLKKNIAQVGFTSLEGSEYDCIKSTRVSENIVHLYLVFSLPIWKHFLLFLIIWVFFYNLQYSFVIFFK